MAGFFGKLPSAGDFVARGLPVGVRPVMDRWLTRYLAEYARAPDRWPDTGLKAVLATPSGPLALTIIASHDMSGRAFPLAACTQELQSAGQIEHWAAQAVVVLTEARDACLRAEEVQASLAAISRDAREDQTSEALTPPLLWSDGPPQAPDVSLPDIFAAFPVELAP